MILTEIGEIGVQFEGLELILSPSLYAMSRIGSPKDIVDTFQLVMEGSLVDALKVIQLCSDRDVSEIFGKFTADDNFNLQFNEMFASPEIILIVAQSLLKHGIIGDVKRQASSKKEYTKEFHAKEFVAQAVAHLGMSERDAWRSTITAIVGALRAKFPPENIDEKYPTLDELDIADAWLDRVNKKRDK